MEATLLTLFKSLSKYTMRLILLLILFCLNSCAQQKGWVYREVISDLPCFDSQLMLHVPSNRFNGIEVQLLQGSFGRIGYLGIYSMHFPAETFSLYIDQQQYLFDGTLMEGGQKMQMPEEAMTLLITALLEGHSVIIYCGNYSTTLLPKVFGKKYAKFQN